LGVAGWVRSLKGVKEKGEAVVWGDELSDLKVREMSFELQLKKSLDVLGRGESQEGGKASAKTISQLDVLLCKKRR